MIVAQRKLQPSERLDELGRPLTKEEMEHFEV